MPVPLTLRHTLSVANTTFVAIATQPGTPTILRRNSSIPAASGYLPMSGPLVQSLVQEGACSCRVGPHTSFHVLERVESTTSRQWLSTWYRNDSSTRWLDPAKQAFENAVEVLRKELSPTDCDLIWLRGKTSMQDVLNALIDARAKHQNDSGRSKLRSILASCSSRVAYYAPVFDSLSQHYPEYVSLAWGAFKFLFTVVINHEELLSELARAVTNIANVLPRTKFLCELYPTEEMQNGIANVYAKILDFVLESVKWYKKSKLQHAFSAVVKPYKLSFKDIVDEIAERSRQVDELANAASKAELRDVNLEVGALRREIQQIYGHFQMLNRTLNGALARSPLTRQYTDMSIMVHRKPNTS
ncbi:hypothetical protein KJ359_010578 [Pestalotiopsis sp. 9143b]|nr:hypothetical protein KJ359_010578 [Pestalotiopsis sp. 9143b]